MGRGILQTFGVGEGVGETHRKIKVINYFVNNIHDKNSKLCHFISYLANNLRENCMFHYDVIMVLYGDVPVLVSMERRDL